MWKQLEIIMFVMARSRDCTGRLLFFRLIISIDRQLKQCDDLLMSAIDGHFTIR